MKKMLRTRLLRILAVGMFFALVISYYLQVKRVQADTDISTKWMFWQTNQVLLDNKRESEVVRNEFYDMCILNARAAAYMIERGDVDVSDLSEMQRIAKLLDVDEIHVFDQEGTIYAGTHPKYYGYSFNSGEQMRFFLPMLADKDLELCQDVTPNTAEAKPMQYAAVWREDGEGIIQIGMEPRRLLNAMERYELSYVFPLVSALEGTDVCAVDPETFEILASTNHRDFVGKSMIDLGLREEELRPTEKSFHTRINGTWNYCMVTSMEDILVVRLYDAAKLYRQTVQSVLVMLVALSAIFLFMLVSILRYMDRKIIHSINEINSKLNFIAAGDFDHPVDVETTPEFTELSLHINNMVMSILSNATKLSYVLNAVRLPIAVYEYGEAMHRVRYTNRLPEILCLEGVRREELLCNCGAFADFLDEIRENPISDEIYRLPGEKDRYLRIESYMGDRSYFGILVDVTADIQEKRRIQRERDEDLLTGLMNRRAFTKRAEELFEQPGQLGLAAIIMMDTDELKHINDTLGHEAGDQYLRGMAEALQGIHGPEHLAARLSGDEFAVLLYGCDSTAEMEECVQALRTHQSGVITSFQGSALTVRFSLGVAYCPADGEEFQPLLKLADQRMYENKRTRKKGKR